MTVQTPPHPQTQYQEYLTNSISGISQLLLTWFWWNFKDRFLGTPRTDYNCNGDICPGNICPRNICPHQKYLSFNWHNFDETLKIGFWEHLEQIWTVMVTIFEGTFVLTTFVHIRTLFWWNFKARFLGTSRTDSNSHICPGNICSGDICTYQKYLSCYWHDLD